jgi:anti-anti-sigma factor
MNPFKLIETDLGDGEREIEIHGELDLAVADQLREAIERTDQKRILINLSSCEFIDSTGIATIVQASQVDGRKLVAHSPPVQVLRILQITGLTDNGLIFEDREAALFACRSA